MGRSVPPPSLLSFFKRYINPGPALSGSLDKLRASQSKPIYTSITGLTKWGSACIFLPQEISYISARVAPRAMG